MSTDSVEGTGGDLVLESLTKHYGSFVAVDHVDLTIPQGSFFALLGPSGCGKTTTLRMVAGLEEPTDGRVLLGGEDISYVKPYKRSVNTVFQNYALFPHLDIFENVAFGLRRRGRKNVREEVMAALDLVQLADYAKRKPSQLSGGQQQRIALARAVVNRPDVLLLDEPLGALDLKLRRQMQVELKQIQTEVGLTFVHVTHDQEEAMTMADTIAVMHSGRIEQLGAPVELYEQPASAYVANFLGQSNLLEARVVERSAEEVVLDVHGQRVRMAAARNKSTGDDVLAGIRPEKVELSEGDAAPGSQNGTALTGGVVTDASFTGMSTQYLVRMPWGQELTVFAQNTGARVVPVGSTATLSWNPEHMFGLDGSEDPDAGAVSGPAGAPGAAVAVG
jgi:spermidine/putrescine transport system ATP-binding protein